MLLLLLLRVMLTVTVPFVMSIGVGFSKAVGAPEGFGEWCNLLYTSLHHGRHTQQCAVHACSSSCVAIWLSTAPDQHVSCTAFSYTLTNCSELSVLRVCLLHSTSSNHTQSRLNDLLLTIMLQPSSDSCDLL
jgi:hypothetical protein